MSDYSKEIELFNATVEKAGELSYIVRDNELQRSALAELSALAAKVEAWKRQAISDQNERYANVFLGGQCVIEALEAELNMWLQLKDGRPDEAWENLVNAQRATRNAIRASRGFSHLEARATRLLNIERVVFPAQVFLSAGLIVRSQQCSICGAEYDDCPHIVGKPYMGEFCRCILKDIEANHIAIVTEPANKQCRVVYFNDEGGKRNRMTWRVEPGSIPDTSGTERKGRVVEGIILSTTDVGAPGSKR
jgi:hypothetical protein